MGGLGQGTAVAVGLGRSTVAAAVHVFAVVADLQRDGVGHQPLFGQAEHQRFGHFPHNELCLFVGIRAGQHLPFGDAVGAGPVVFDLRQAAGFHAPGMVNKQFRIHTKSIVQPILVVQRHARQLPHGVDTVGFQLFDGGGAGHPEIRHGAVVPQQIPERFFVQLGNAHTVCIRRNVLGYNVHGQLCQIKVGANARRCRDAGALLHIPHHFHGQFVGRELVQGQVAGHINEHLINGIGVNILRGNVLEVNFIDLRRHGQVPCHARRGYDIIQLQRRVCRKGRGIPAGRRKLRPPLGVPHGLVQAHRRLQPLGIHLPDTLHHLKQPRPPRDAVRLEGRRHGKADGFFGAGSIRHHHVGGQGIQFAVHALHRCIKAFQVNGQIRSLPCHSVTFSQNRLCALQLFILL